MKQISILLACLLCFVMSSLDLSASESICSSASSSRNQNIPLFDYEAQKSINPFDLLIREKPN